MERCSSLKRMVPFTVRSRRIRTCHLLPMRVRVVSTGHAGRSSSLVPMRHPNHESQLNTLVSVRYLLHFVVPTFLKTSVSLSYVPSTHRCRNPPQRWRKPQHPRGLGLSRPTAGPRLPARDGISLP